MHYIQYGTYIYYSDSDLYTADAMILFWRGHPNGQQVHSQITIKYSQVNSPPLGILHCTPAVNTFRIMYLLVDTSKHHTPGDIKNILFLLRELTRRAYP